ncbi:HAMP domain-containing protein [bacterium]|nr:MAG: HAMP domain-containing protein [bacterium]
MQTLFGKIFLWFFFAQVLIGTAMLGVGFAQREASTPPPVRDMLGDELERQSVTAVSLAQSGQLEKFPFRRGRGGGRTVIYWYPPRGPVKSYGRSSTPELLEFSERTRLSGAVQWMQNDKIWAVAKPSLLENGSVVVVSQLPRRGRPFFSFVGDWFSPDGRVRLVMALGVMALVCYGLARHLTAPVARLSEATQRLAEGDLTARVGFRERGGDELIELGRDFDRMAARLEASTESERRLLGDISHELRSPLARLSVALDLVEQGRARAESKGEKLPETTYIGALDRIRRESGRLNEMIGQLLELTRLESLAEGAPLPDSVQNVSLDEVVNEVVADAKYEARSRTCDVELLHNEHCVLNGIEPLIHSAIENVVRNAVRYTGEGTCVQVSLRRSSPSEEKPQAIVTVRDFGTGIPKESLQAVFKPFYRVAQGRERQSGGVGLGLAIAQRALRVHGATIEARNASDGGLEVEIRFPLDSRKAAGSADSSEIARSTE